ncbi:hypothetical protein D3C76_886890 [compost metagenome]
MVIRQLKHRLLTGQARAPVGQLALALAGFEPVALPGGEVGVLQRQWRQGVALVERAQFANHHLHRPGVGDDVVLHQHQQVFIGGHAHQAHAQQATAGQVERLAEQAADEGLARGFIQALRLQVQRPWGEDLLARLLAVEGEGGAQGFVAGDQLVEGLVQRGDVQRAMQAQHTGDVVGAAGRVELPQQPLAFLGEGQRQLLARSLSLDAAGPGALQVGQRLAEIAQAGLVEQQAQGKLQGQLVAQARDHPGNQKRVTAEGEEVVRQPHTLGLEQLGPGGRDMLLQGAGRRQVFRLLKR